MENRGILVRYVPFTSEQRQKYLIDSRFHHESGESFYNDKIRSVDNRLNRAWNVIFINRFDKEKTFVFMLMCRLFSSIYRWATMRK